MAQDYDDNEGLDVWDIALPIGGALLGGKAGRHVIDATKKGRWLQKALNITEADSKAATAAWEAEFNASRKKLADNARGKIALSRDEELHHRRVVSEYELETPGAGPDSLDDSRAAQRREFDAWYARGSNRNRGRIAGALGGGGAGYAASHSRDKRRK